MNLTNYTSASYTLIVKDYKTKGYNSLEEDRRRPTSTTDAAHTHTKKKKNPTILIGSETTQYPQTWKLVCCLRSKILLYMEKDFQSQIFPQVCNINSR